VVSGGFPCQDISAAGKGAGIEGERSGMWKHMARIIGEVLPRFVWVENSPMLVGRGLGVVLADLAKMGYDARWGIVGAHHAGAPHKRDRIWIVGYSNATGDQSPEKQRRQVCQSGSLGQNVADAGCTGHESECRSREAHGTASQAEGETQQRQRSRADTGSSGQDVADAMRGPEQEQGHKSNAELSEREAWVESGSGGAFMGYTPISGLPHGPAEPMGEPRTDAQSERSDWWATEPDVGRVAHGVAARVDIHGANAAGNVERVAKGISNRVDRLRCIGNGQVSAVVPLAWHLLSPQPPEN
jgi:DNA (cytosine-5)-methyltransferase 1